MFGLFTYCYDNSCIMAQQKLTINWRLAKSYKLTCPKYQNYNMVSHYSTEDLTSYEIGKYT